MKCSNCGNELTSDMYSSGMCFSCGQSISDSEKAIMEELDKQKSEQQEKINQQKIELQNQYDEKLKNHMLTTGYAFDGYVISKYHGLVSGEYVIGSGLASYLEACITTPLGMDTYGYSLFNHIFQGKQSNSLPWKIWLNNPSLLVEMPSSESLFPF